MRSRYNSQWAALGTAVVKVRTQGDQRLQYRDRRLNKRHALLLGPTCALRIRHALEDRNADVLVQSDKPVLFCRLVEQGALDSHGSRRKERADPGVRFESQRQLLAALQVEEIP